MNSSPQINVRVHQHMNASPERIFDAWLDPELIGRWMFGPALRDEEIVRINVEAQVGGAFSFVVRRQGQEIDHVGQYLEMDRPHRLAFTWGTADTKDHSHVSVEVVPAESGCDVTLVHQLHPDWADYADRTEAAWSQMLRALATVMG